MRVEEHSRLTLIPSATLVDSRNSLFTLLQVRRSADDSWAVIGLSSWGEGCATQGKYGVYTQLKSYMRWIKRKITPRRKDKNKNKD